MPSPKNPHNSHDEETYRGNSQSPRGSRASSRRSSGSGENGEESPGRETIKPKRHPSKQVGPKLNTWDVPEFLPGAMPSATPVQKAYFEERSKKVYNNNLIMDQIEAEASLERRQQELAEKLESDMTHLRELFPMIELDTIQESYLLFEGDLNSTINQLLVLSQATGSGGATPSVARKVPPSSEDAREFPTLKDRDGWEVVNMQMTVEEGPTEGYKHKLLNNTASDAKKP